MFSKVKGKGFEYLFDGKYSYSFSPDDKNSNINSIIVTYDLCIDFFEFCLEVNSITATYDKTIFRNITCEENDVYEETNKVFGNMSIAMDNFLIKEFPKVNDDFYDDVVDEIRALFSKKFEDRFCNRVG